MGWSPRETDSCRIFVTLLTRTQCRLYPVSHQPSPWALANVFNLNSCLILGPPRGQFRSAAPTERKHLWFLIDPIRATSPANPAINYLALKIFFEGHILQRTSRYILYPFVQIFSWAPRFLNIPHQRSSRYQSTRKTSVKFHVFRDKTGRQNFWTEWQEAIPRLIRT